MEALTAVRHSVKELARVPGLKISIEIDPASKLDLHKQPTAEDLRLTRQAWGAAQADVARALVVRPITLCAWESGQIVAGV